MHIHYKGASAPGLTTPNKCEAPGVMAEGFRDQGQDDGADFHATGIADQAALVIEGQAYALAYFERLDRGTAQPGELAVLLSFLAGEMLHGACRVIEKALEGRHHA
jgi:hypothetical protein